MIVNEILKALTYLFIAAIVYYAYRLSRHSRPNRNGTLVKGFLWCTGIALFGSVILGHPSCFERDEAGCVEFADDGYSPTTEQRAANFAYIFTLLYIPVLVGAFDKPKNGNGNSQP